MGHRQPSVISDQSRYGYLGFDLMPLFHPIQSRSHSQRPKESSRWDQAAGSFPCILSENSFFSSSLNLSKFCLISSTFFVKSWSGSAIVFHSLIVSPRPGGPQEGCGEGDLGRGDHITLALTSKSRRRKPLPRLFMPIVGGRRKNP